MLWQKQVWGVKVNMKFFQFIFCVHCDGFVYTIECDFTVIENLV